MHGTSNVINEFFPTGLVVASHEDEVTFGEFFKTLNIALNFLLADGSKAITNGKKLAWPQTNPGKIDKQRLMCYPHVDR